jgi:hypothetical protein
MDERPDYRATAAKLRELARQVQSDYCRDQLLRIAQGFDRLAKHAEEWRLGRLAALTEDQGEKACRAGIRR